MKPEIAESVADLLARDLREDALGFGRIDPTRATNTLRVTFYGLDWPFTGKPGEKQPAASSRRRSHCQDQSGPGIGMVVRILFP
jgi:hypothetical protein